MKRSLSYIVFATILIMLFLNLMACEKDSTEIISDSEDYSEVELTYPIAGTGQLISYNLYEEISEPLPGEEYYGQNAQYPGNSPEYRDNGDGTISDLVTGLMWSQTPDLNKDLNITVEDKLTYYNAIDFAEKFDLAGYSDWRLPTIKELYSLIMFSGFDPSGMMDNPSENLVPFINTQYFEFNYGDTNAGERIIDSQFATSTLYTGSTMGGNKTMFGVNFADGRIKGYPVDPLPGQSSGKMFYVYYVRGNTGYGQNDFRDNGDGTITDHATGLMWTQADNGEPLSWKDALAYAENADFAGYSDWRLPDAKELQSIVDYSRSPDATSSAAIDPLFSCTSIINEGGQKDYPCYWSNTTHANSSFTPGSYAAYVCFGRALGYFMHEWMDVHGAGAQRSDPKVDSRVEFPVGHGPQGDAIRGVNYVRLVRDLVNRE